MYCPSAVFTIGGMASLSGKGIFSRNGVDIWRIIPENASSFLEGFPSGQRGQTVNLLAQPSEVRILPPPPYLKILAPAVVGGRMRTDKEVRRRRDSAGERRARRGGPEGGTPQAWSNPPPSTIFICSPVAGMGGLQGEQALRQPASRDRRRGRAVKGRVFSGCSLMVELQPSKLTTWVRFPSPAPGFVLAGCQGRQALPR